MGQFGKSLLLYASAEINYQNVGNDYAVGVVRNNIGNVHFK